MHKYLADYFRALTERGDAFLACVLFIFELRLEQLDSSIAVSGSNVCLFSSEYYVEGAVLRDEETAALVAGQLLALHVLDYQFCVRPTPPLPSPTAPSEKRHTSAPPTAAAHPFDAPVLIKAHHLEILEMIQVRCCNWHLRIHCFTCADR